ncbi:hypothetical protein ACFYK2_18615, partial [Proteus mirabilis]
TYTNDFFNSSLARFPRRTTEELFDRTQNCIWTSPKTSFSESMTFSDLHNIIGSLLKEENEHKDSYITLKDR